MDQSKMDAAKKMLEKFSNEEVSQEDLQKAEKKSSGLKDRINDFRLLISMFKDGISGKYKISGTTLATIGGAIAYVVSPIDVIPDFLPIIGLTDDIAIVGFVINRLSKEISKYKEFKKEPQGIKKDSESNFPDIIIDPKKKRLAILGITWSAQSNFLAFLRNAPSNNGFLPPNSLSHNFRLTVHKIFEYKLLSGEIITVDAIVDIMLKNFYYYKEIYKEATDEADFTIYGFDLGKYLNFQSDREPDFVRKSYEERFECVHSIIKTGKNILVVAFYEDKETFLENKMQQQFENMVQDKTYKELINGMRYVNCTSTDELKELVNTIF